MAAYPRQVVPTRPTLTPFCAGKSVTGRHMAGRPASRALPGRLRRSRSFGFPRALGASPESASGAAVRDFVEAIDLSDCFRSAVAWMQHEWRSVVFPTTGLLLEGAQRNRSGVCSDVKFLASAGDVDGIKVRSVRKRGGAGAVAVDGVSRGNHSMAKHASNALSVLAVVTSRSVRNSEPDRGSHPETRTGQPIGALQCSQGALFFSTAHGLASLNRSGAGYHQREFGAGAAGDQHNAEAEVASVPC